VEEAERYRALEMRCRRVDMEEAESVCAKIAVRLTKGLGIWGSAPMIVDTRPSKLAAVMAAKMSCI